MTRRPIEFLVVGGLVSFAFVVAASQPANLAAANKTANAKTATKTKKPIRNPKFDPKAEKVALFDALKANDIDAKLIPNDSKSGTVLIENKTDKPLTVKVPEAVVGISIHAQGGFGGGMGGMGGGMGGMGGMGGGMGGMGGGQMMGGGMGGGMGGMGGGMGMGGMGGGMFSIPPQSVVSVPFNSVCLEHGKPEPNSRMKYALIPVSKVNPDPVLYRLLEMVGSGKVDTQSAQAAAWNLANKMSFEELAAKTDEQLGSLTSNPYFSEEQLMGARRLLNLAADRASDDVVAEKSDSDSESAGDRTSASRTSQVSGN